MTDRKRRDRQRQETSPPVSAEDTGDVGFAAVPGDAVPGRMLGVPSRAEAAKRLGVSESTMRRYLWEWAHPKRTRWDWQFYGSREALWGGFAGFTIGILSGVGAAMLVIAANC